MDENTTEDTDGITDIGDYKVVFQIKELSHLQSDFSIPTYTLIIGDFKSVTEFIPHQCPFRVANKAAQPQQPCRLV